MSNISHIHAPNPDKERLEEEDYKGFHIQILQTVRNTFLWEFKKQTTQYHNGEEASLAEARRAAHDYIDEVFSARTDHADR